MKKMILPLLLLFPFAGALFSQTSGELSVTVTTSATPGNFAPKNIVAIWIEDEAGNFVKTLLAYAQQRKTHLNTWQASTGAAGSEFNTVDAVTGATRTSHGTRSCTWNATRFSGNLVDDGTYKVWMELTDKNGTGNFSSFSFVKGPDPVALTPANVPSFANISITWSPAAPSEVSSTRLEDGYSIYPNPSEGLYFISGTIDTYEVRSIPGEILQSGRGSIVDIRQFPDGVYLFILKTEKGVFVKKALKSGAL